MNKACAVLAPRNLGRFEVRGRSLLLAEVQFHVHVQLLLRLWGRRSALLALGSLVIRLRAATRRSRCRREHLGHLAGRLPGDPTHRLRPPHRRGRQILGLGLLLLRTRPNVSRSAQHRETARASGGLRARPALITAPPPSLPFPHLLAEVKRQLLFHCAQSIAQQEPSRALPKEKQDAAALARERATRALCAALPQGYRLAARVRSPLRSASFSCTSSCATRERGERARANTRGQRWHLGVPHVSCPTRSARPAAAARLLTAMALGDLLFLRLCCCCACCSFRRLWCAACRDWQTGKSSSTTPARAAHAWRDAPSEARRESSRRSLGLISIRAYAEQSSCAAAQDEAALHPALRRDVRPRRTVAPPP